MSASHTPPRPHPTLRIGVVGDASLTDGPALRAQIRVTLAEVTRVATQVHTECADVYHGAVQCILVTSLDTPAARMVAEEALGQGSAVHLLLASAETPDNLASLHQRAASVRVICGASPAVLGRALLRHTDLLFVIGEVADVSAQAQVWQIPIVRADHATDRATAVSDDTVAAIRATLLPPPVNPADPGHDHLRQYLQARAAWGLGGLFASIVRLVAWERPRFPRVVALGPAVAHARRDWHDLWTHPEPLDPALARPIAHALSEPYIWADGLANRYGTLHRDTSTAPYVVAFLAAMVATQIGDIALRVTPVAVAWLVFLLYRRAVAARYHDRWIDYRSLAEQLRQLAFLWPVGRPLRAVRVRGEGASEAPQLAWVGWYARAIARQVGLFPGVFTAERVVSCRDMIVERFIEPQYQYHTRGIRRFHTVQRRLHIVTLTLFWATLLLATVRVIVPAAMPRTIVLTVAAAAILLPALAAAVHGFSGVGDFSNLVRRSTRMADELRPLMTEMGSSSTVVPLTAPLTLEAVGDAAEAAAEVMGDEVLNWRVFVRLKAPSLS